MTIKFDRTDLIANAKSMAALKELELPVRKAYIPRELVELMQNGLKKRLQELMAGEESTSVDVQPTPGSGDSEPR